MIFRKVYIYFSCLAESTAQQYLGPARMLTYTIINVPLLHPEFLFTFDPSNLDEVFREGVSRVRSWIIDLHQKLNVRSKNPTVLSYRANIYLDFETKPDSLAFNISEKS